MVKYSIIPGEPVLLDEQAEIFITKIISEIVLSANLHYTIEQGAVAPCVKDIPCSGNTPGQENTPCCKVYAYNICKDHVHMLIECSRIDIANTIRLLKGKSAQRYKEFLGIDAGKEFHLWAQKYNKWLIQSEDQFRNTVSYIIWNRHKHGLIENKGLQPLVLRMIQGCGNTDHIAGYEYEFTRTFDENSQFMDNDLYGLTEEEIRIMEGR